MLRSLIPSPALALLGALACARPSPAPATPADEGAQDEEDEGESSGSTSRWTYEIAIDEELARMDLGLCIQGPPPLRLSAGDEALDFLISARVRGGAELTRERETLKVGDLGPEGCVDLEIDLAAAAEAGGRDSTRRGDTLMVTPRAWLWHPAKIPDNLEARARFELPEGVHATVPWPALEADSEAGPDSGEAADWRRLDDSAFRWSAWIAFGRYRPLEFRAAECEFEVAILAGEHAASEAGVEDWLRVAAETSAELFGRFPRERVSVVVVPSPGWGDEPVFFGMARRGGGASAMLMLNGEARDPALIGEWVAAHEFLHFGMPLVGDPWMSEGFVTYYTQVLRARRGVLDLDELPRAELPPEDFRAFQAREALAKLAAGFDRRTRRRRLAEASANMRKTRSYSRVYWGGAAAALDLDLALRRASQGRRSLDDLMIHMAARIPETRRWRAEELLELCDAEVERWREAGELEAEISPSEILARHLEAKAIPDHVQELRGLAVEFSRGDVRLLAHPIDEVRLRRALFAPRRATKNPGQRALRPRHKTPQGAI